MAPELKALKFPSSINITDILMNEIYITYKRNLGDILCLAVGLKGLFFSAKYYEPVVNGEWMCQSILRSSILLGVPSDKHMAGIEPRGIWTTTDAIQATLCLLAKPDWEDALKTRALKKNELERGFSLMAWVH